MSLAALSVRQSEAEPVHCCVVCDFPVQVYGRLAPCNHFFCLECTQDAKTCPLCQAAVEKVASVGYRQQIYACLHPQCYKGYLSKFSLNEHQRLRNHFGISPVPGPIKPIASIAPTIQSELQNQAKLHHPAGIPNKIAESVISEPARAPNPPASVQSPSNPQLATVLQYLSKSGIQLPPNISEADLMAVLSQSGVQLDQLLASIVPQSVHSVGLVQPSVFQPSQAINPSFQQSGQPFVQQPPQSFANQGLQGQVNPNQQIPNRPPPNARPQDPRQQFY